MSEINYLEQRTEEVQHIIDKMPSRFGLWVTGIVVFIFSLIFIFGWVVRYPDIVPGEIVINANSSPLKLIANTNGKLKLNNVGTMENVSEGQIIAYIENPTNPKSIFFVDNLLKHFDPNLADPAAILKKFPRNFSLGELNPKYYAFTNALQELTNYKQDKLLDKQTENLGNLLSEQKNSIEALKERVEMSRSSLIYAQKFYKRDSILFNKKVISEFEFDKTELSYLQSKDALQNAINNLITSRQSAQQSTSKIQELDIQKPEKGNELKIKLVSAYNDLLDNIKSWEQKYVFRAPFSGKVQFLKFYNENQFVISGEEVFSIIPKQNKVFGQVSLPSKGSGKIKIGQEVIVKLDDFPFMEYGSVTGKIKSISLTTNITKTDNSNVDTYMLLVDFPYQLRTNYGKSLEFKAEAKGSAEVITNDRRLIQRLFENLKYILNK